MLRQLIVSNSKKESKPQTQPVYYEVFRDHWKQVLAIFNKSLINDDDIQIVKSNLNQMINLLLDELNNLSSYLTLKSNESDNTTISLSTTTTTTTTSSSSNSTISNETINYGPIWDFVFKANIFETIFLWSLSYPEYLFELKVEQLKYYECLIYQMQAYEQTNLLLQTQINKPLFSLLNHCSTHNSELIEKLMISILNQLCVCICKNSNLLEIFFQQQQQHKLNQSSSSSNNHNMHSLAKSVMLSSAASSSSKFFIFSLLIPYIHKEGCLGQQARDALLMIMQLSARNPNLAKYIVENTDFCPILATGLSGLYSELPQKLTTSESFDEIRYLSREDIISIPALNKFINSLEFCNNVIQVSHSLIANQLLQYVYYGFLVPVIAPALTQNCVDEIIASTAYLDLFLRTINEPNLLKIFLKFVLYAKFDEKSTLLETLINRINSNTRLSLVTLMLFSTMIDFNSEDVMYKLIFIYLLPCKHLMKSQILNLKQSSSDINGLNAQTFLSLATNFDNLDTKSNGKQNSTSYAATLLNDSTALSKWFQSLFESNEANNLVGYLDGMRFNFVDYLKDAKLGIMHTTTRTYKWSFNYDTSTSTKQQTTNKPSSDSLLAANKRPAHELDFDAEEYLLNLNIFTTSLIDPSSNVKSARTTVNLFSSTTTNNTNADYDTISLVDKTDPQMINNNNKTKRRLKKNSKSQTTTTSCEPSLAFDDLNSFRDEFSCKKEKLKKKVKKKKKQTSDFYFLTFDNELSDSDDDDVSSNDDDTNKDEDDETEEDEEEEDDDDESDDLTTATVSSSATLNNDLIELHDYRLKLIDYLFSNEENNKLYLNGNLNNFLFALDDLFKQNSSFKIDTKKDINILCDQILNIYNEFFKFKTSNSNQRNDSFESKDSAVASSSTHNLTQFPAYETQSAASHHSSLQSLNLVDSCEPPLGEPHAHESHSHESDIGPFLCALFNRLDHMLSNSLQINFYLTGLFAKLAYYPQLLLRSFLLNHNLVVQSNIKTLIQVLSNVKFKIDACSKTYNNFSLLYFKAKLFLIKRIIDSKSIRIGLHTSKSQDKLVKQNESSTPQSAKKKFTIDRLLNFFKSSSTDSESKETDNKSALVSPVLANELLSPQAELDLNEISFKFGRFNTKKFEANLLKQFENVDDFYLIENEWEDLKTRNIALSAVIYDEFIKELAAICQEHSVLSYD